MTLNCFRPPSFLQSRLESILTKFLLLLVVQLFLQFHVFRIYAEYIFRKLSSVPENCPYKWIMDFLLDFRCFEDLSAPPELMWFFARVTLNPLSRQVLHNHCMLMMQSGFLLLITNLVFCCYHITKSFGNFKSVRPIFKISSAWRSCNFPSSAYFAIGVFPKPSELRFLGDLFIVVSAGGCAERGIAGGGISTSAGDTSLELEDPLAILL